MEVDSKYPYLGVYYVERNEDITKAICYVVFFNEPNHGVVLMNNTSLENIEFGQIGEFDENDFEVLPKGVPVRLEN